MSLRKRGGIWWVDVVAPNRGANTPHCWDCQQNPSAGVSRPAQGRAVAASRSWARSRGRRGTMRWCGGSKEQSHKATARKMSPSFAGWISSWAARTSSTSTAPSLDRITDAKLAQGCSNATVNRTLELLRAILRKCVNDWEWLDRAPSVRMLKEPTRRIRFLTRDEAQRLLAALPEHLADMAAFSLATGLRAANVTGLQWSQVDLTRRLAWIHPDQAKARKAIRGAAQRGSGGARAASRSGST
mgnify:CR=1 FL=1